MVCRRSRTVTALGCSWHGLADRRLYSQCQVWRSPGSTHAGVAVCLHPAVFCIARVWGISEEDAKVIPLGQTISSHGRLVLSLHWDSQSIQRGGFLQGFFERDLAFPSQARPCVCIPYNQVGSLNIGTWSSMMRFLTSFALDSAFLTTLHISDGAGWMRFQVKGSCRKLRYVKDDAHRECVPGCRTVPCLWCWSSPAFRLMP